MKTNRKYKWLILPTVALIVFMITLLLRKFPQFVESVYAGKIYPVIASVLSRINSVTAFSIDDVFYFLLLLIPIFLIILVLLKRLKPKTSGKFLLNVLAATYVAFYLFWGFNYFRQPLHQRLEIKDRTPDTEEFVQFIQEYIQNVNVLHCGFDSIDKKNVDTLIEESYEKLAPDLHFNYPMGLRNDKKITFSGFYSKTGITGYFGPFFNEVHVNKMVLPIEYPYILAHEKAHQLGVTSEAEANFYSWLVCSNSSSQQIRYSANLFILLHFMRQAYGLEEYKVLAEQISPEVKADIKTVREHWAELRNEKMDRTASKLNNAYLKHNNIKSGIKDYTGVVDHVMNFSLDSAFQQRYDLTPH